MRCWARNACTALGEPPRSGVSRGVIWCARNKKYVAACDELYRFSRLDRELIAYSNFSA